MQSFLISSFYLKGTYTTNDRRRGICVLDELMLTSNSLPAMFAMDIPIMGCWHIWMQRNSKIFNAPNPSIQSWRFLIRYDLQLVQIRVKSKYKEGFSHRIVTFDLEQLLHMDFPRAGNFHELFLLFLALHIFLI